MADLKQILAQSTGITEEEAQRKLSTIADALASFCGDCDSVAIPGFGTFQTTKRDENISADSTGKKTLNPPQIEVEFKPSVVLRKILS